jgi:hypothetical protein
MQSANEQNSNCMKLNAASDCKFTLYKYRNLMSIHYFLGRPIINNADRNLKVIHYQCLHPGQNLHTFIYIYISNNLYLHSNSNPLSNRYALHAQFLLTKCILLFVYCIHGNMDNVFLDRTPQIILISKKKTGEAVFSLLSYF